MINFTFELVREALKNLARHKLRSFLTALGIIFGVASVIAMISAGEGARREILAQISELGTTNIIINAKKPPAEEDVQLQQGGGNNELQHFGLTFRDAEQIRSTLPAVTEVLPVHDVEKWIWLKSRRLEAKVRGVTPAYLRRLRMVPIQGRSLTELDGQTRARVCVVRAGLIRQAKYMGDPLQLDLKVGSQFFRVVGVLPARGFQSTNSTVLRLDGRALEVYVPFETVTDRFGLVSRGRAGEGPRTRVELHQVVCTINSEENVLEAAKAIGAILERFHPRRDYEVTIPLELLAQRQRTQRVFNLVLPVIAGISLLVGGIGILNIMLASITERTREIGIRRALGATQADITIQFLIETVTLSVVGGLLGIALGVAGVAVLEAFTNWQPVITQGAVGLSMGISCLTGIVFGIYPARRAALMDPIAALRHD
ncbi:MAG: ABC transporter permease [Planctomycetes bacterium]|nr:ABC transporter permease [Planctomycetota bacterium]